MSYQALYRVWRPQRFCDVVGQEHIAQTLKNALTTGRLSHAYLFSGPRGTGKTSAAKILAKAVNCLEGPSSEPCNECTACKGVTSGSLMDVMEIDAASNRGVDEIRDLRDKVKYAPTEVRFKVYIIDEVHMLTTEAFNALLKTLEEPPKHILFILATTEPQKLPLTIISRCQRFSFRRIPLEKIVERLKEVCIAQGIEVEEGAISAIARIADGGMRDALSILDQCLGLCDTLLEEKNVYRVTGTISREVITTLFKASIDQKVGEALDCLDQSIADGFDPEKMMEDMISGCRDLLMIKKAPSMVEKGMDLSRSFYQLTEGTSSQKLLEMLDILISYQSQMKWTPYPRIFLEMVLIRLCSPPEEKENSKMVELEKRVVSLEEMIRQEGSRARSQLPKNSEQESVQKKEKAVRVSRKQERYESSLEHVERARQLWPDILRQVKEEKVTVHAWLVDGEVVGATPNMVMVSFRSNIHRETTEKEANRALIESVLERTLGTPTQLKTCMADERGEMSQKDKNAEQPSKEVDVVARAIEIFGEDLVEVCSSREGE